MAAISAPGRRYTNEARPLSTSASLDTARFYSYDAIPANQTSAKKSEASQHFPTECTADLSTTLTHYYGHRYGKAIVKSAEKVFHA